MRLSKRTEGTMGSYIMKLISVANEPGMISLATGLPDKRLFDVQGICKATEDVLKDDPSAALQYGTTEGHVPLRKKIASRCSAGLGFRPKIENIFITNGSQECFDHMGKLLIDPGDTIAVENPGYLGALQSFSVYSPKFIGIDLNEKGPNTLQLADSVKNGAKLYYGIPNHQNPSGVSYSADVRKEVAEIIGDSDCLMIEDDAYGELGFKGRVGRTVRSMNDNIVLTGSFSKIISPGMRIGWMVVPDELTEAARTSLEASFLHANTFSQAVMDRFLVNNDLSTYLVPIRKEYERKCRLMLDLLEDRIPDGKWNEPDGGMFIWFRVPDGKDAMKLFDRALERKVVIMPGRPFHTSGGNDTIRLNYATASDEEIKEGMERLAKAFYDVFQR